MNETRSFRVVPESQPQSTWMRFLPKALFSLIISVFCFVLEYAIVVLVEVLRYSVPAVKSLLKEDLFFLKEIVERAVKF